MSLIMVFGMLDQIPHGEIYGLDPTFQSHMGKFMDLF